MTKRKQTHADIFVTEVEGLTLRDFSGDGTQSELLIRTRTGTLALRLVARRGRVPRLIDMRASDRKRRRERWVSVPMTAVKPSREEVG